MTDTQEKTAQEKTVTVIYYSETSLALLHEVCTFPLSDGGRVILDDDFKKGKSIVAICSGEVEILNKTGDRVLPQDPIE